MDNLTKIGHLKWLLKAVAMSPALLYLWLTKLVFDDYDFDYLWEDIVKPGFKTHFRLLADKNTPWF